MLRFYASFFVESMYKLHKWETEWSHAQPQIVLPSPVSVAANVGVLALECAEYEMNGALGKCLRIDAYCKSPERAINPLTYGEASRQLKELRESLEDDSKAHVFLQVNLAEQKWYENPTDEWEPIIAKFCNTRSDIEECSKCYALSRYPAAVFHSLQIVELGLIALGKFLELKDPKSGWTSVCKDLKRITTGDYQKLTASERKHFSFLEQVHGTAEALKNAWRNKIDHAMNRLTLLPGEFNQEIAHDIIVASRHFMRRLAAELPEGTINT